MGFLFFERLAVLEMSVKANNQSLQALSGPELNLYYSTKFNAFLQTLIKIIAFIDDALIRLQSYKQFLDGSRSLDALAKSWLSYNEPGMIYHWERLFPEQAMLEKNQVIINDLKQASHFLLEEAQGTQIEALRTQSVELPYLLSELERAMSLSDIAELKSLSEAFRKSLVSESEHRALTLLFEALLLILKQQDGDQALDYLMKVHFDSPLLQNFMLKEKLKLALQLQHYEAIVDTYRALCESAPEFLPAFANYWLIINQPQQALPLLQAHLQQQPEDLEAQLRLLRVWIALSDFTQANALLSQLKNRYPGNSELARLAMNLTNQESEHG
jgi:hypothetical protein